MTIARPPEPATLVVGMLSGDVTVLDAAEAELAAAYGPIDLRSPDIDFDFTDYYEPQMGKGLRRRFVSFARKIDPADLAAIKRRTNDIEAAFARRSAGVPRPLNLDPGYVCASKLVLASTKDHAHRIYLRDGIYAEITLSFRGKSFVPLETTYPDYRSAAYLEFFTRVRQRHVGRKANDASTPPAPSSPPHS